MRETQRSAAAAAKRARVSLASVDSRLNASVERATQHLFSLQASDGYWWGELEADTTLESDCILLDRILGDGPNGRVARFANYIRKKQQAHGGWNIYPGGPAEISTCVKAYLALRLSGDRPEAPHMERAKKKIHALGGLERTNSYVRFYLAMIGAIGWDLAPAIPPELILVPRWMPVNLYEMSSWTRAIIVPLSIVYALKPDWRMADFPNLDELFRDRANAKVAFAWSGKIVSWRNVFLACDKALKLHERMPWKPFRARAMAKAQQWLFEHVERSEGLATIIPAMANSIYAMLALGFPTGDGLVRRELGWINAYGIAEGDTLRMQPCISPVWDTAIAMVSLAEAGVEPSHPALQSASRWLIDHQILGPGDWQVKNKDAPPGGWAFEFRNDFFPDVDDTAFVLMALQQAVSDPPRFEQAARRGMAWLLSMQNRDGGWGAFDRDNDNSVMTNIPFADHNAMIDPSSADVAARSVECLAHFGWRASHPAIQRALAYFRREQTPEGAWYGRWGVNYVYGTSGVLRAMEALGLSDTPECRKAAEWLKKVQNADGGFGESCQSYEKHGQKAVGKSTASQTAWGLIGLLATVGAEDQSVLRAVDWLTEHQNEDGSWDEDQFTGTGFPCVFYLKYHLYRNSFPLYALARYRNMRNGTKAPHAFQFDPNQFKYRNGRG